MATIHPDKENPELLEPGNYELMVVKASENTNEATGNISAALTLQVMDGPAKGSEFVDWLGLGDKSMWKTVPILRGMGLEVPTEGDFDLDVQALKGINFVGTVIKGELGGRPRNSLEASKPSSKKFGIGKASELPF